MDKSTHPVIWNGGTKDWTATRHVHLTKNDYKTLCGLRITGYYETYKEAGKPDCGNCLRLRSRKR